MYEAHYYKGMNDMLFGMSPAKAENRWNNRYRRQERRFISGNDYTMMLLLTSLLYYKTYSNFNSINWIKSLI